jgi:hypothetical protein
VVEMKRLILATLVITAVLLTACTAPSTPSETPATPPPPAAIEITAEELYAAYEANQVAADAQYKDKILKVTGVINSIGKDILDTPYVVITGGGEYEVWGVQCMFGKKDESELAQLTKGQIVTIQGKCSGYLINVLLDDCSLKSVSSPPAVNLSASFTVTDWEQDYYEYLEEWSDYVSVYYTVENTGNVDIDYYTVYFVAKCKDGSEYQDWTSGFNVGVGRTLSDETIISVAGKEVRDVEVVDWELTTY